MLGNFVFSNPTKLYFGEDSLKYLNEELPKYGKNVQLVYGGGSIKKTGIYDKVVEILKANGKKIFEDGDVMPNPTVEKLHEGVQIARDHQVDFILAVGGGSCCDYAKAVSISVNCKDEPWEKYYLKYEDVDADTEIVPVGCVLTMVGTGSEMNGGAVITDHESKLKIGHIFGERVFPKFAVLNPTFTYSLPKYQMTAGFYDILNHICEQYFSGEDDNTSDYIMEGLMCSLIHSSRIAINDPENYEVRSHIMPYGLAKFKRFAIHVWDVNPEGKTDEAIAAEGLSAMEAWMREIGVVMSIKELGVKEDMLDDLVKSTLVMEGGYKVLTQEEIKRVFKESM